MRMEKRKNMHRFYVQAERIQGETVWFDGTDAAHMHRVLRMKEGDDILVCDGQSHEYHAVIVSIDKRDVRAKLLSKEEMQSEPDAHITLFQGYPKAGKLDMILQKGTEIGVARFVPFYSEYGDVKPQASEKKERWNRIVYEAAKQTGRGRIPEVSEAVAWKALSILLAACDLVLVAYESEEETGLRDIAALQTAKHIGLVVGPEGGFSDAEIDEMKQLGAKIITLGPRILRTETAGMVFPALVLYQRGEME